MAVSRRSSRPRFVLLLLVLTAITLVTIDDKANGGGITSDVRSAAHTVFAPIQSATHSVLRPVGNFFSGVFSYGSLKSENARLRDQLAQARAQALDSSNAQHELQILSEQQHLDFAGSVPTVAAQVIQDSPSNFEVSIDINRGTSSGVAVGMPVVTGGGLIGRVNEVSSNAATVVLLTDPTFSVGVRLASNGQVFVADGTGLGKPMSLELVGSGVKLKVGDRLVTSGLSMEEFPPDIPVGVVRSVTSSPGELLQVVTANPAADVTRLEYVQVLQWSPQIVTPTAAPTTTVPAPAGLGTTLPGLGPTGSTTGSTTVTTARSTTGSTTATTARSTTGSTSGTAATAGNGG
ncbi:MAG: rod shape-determining protein MreC [Acidimicrobiales bacterium]